MKAHELIEKLRKIPKDTEIVLWQWLKGDKEFINELTPTLNAYQKKKCQFFLTIGERYSIKHKKE